MSWSEVIPCELKRVSERSSKQGQKAYSNTKSSEVLTVLLLRLSGEHLGEESDRVDCQIERVDVVLGEVCGMRERSASSLKQ